MREVAVAIEARRHELRRRAGAGVAQGLGFGQ
ncbi:hypothetical protein X726_19560 [Mesorhizobium sp. L103C105A0]|nr:hypothetical protein X726_19560 [Mesorhizobium sp. L103C105A0]